MRKQICYLSALATLSLLSGCLSAEEAAVEDEGALGITQESIINGYQPARGSMQGLGVVRLSNGCTGTLLTNRHVLTARHCIRTWNNNNSSWGALQTPLNAILEADTAANDQVIGNDTTAASGGIFELGEVPGDPLPHSLDPDYAIIQLAAPMQIGSATDNFRNPITSVSDDTLATWSLTCVGYGFGTLATGTACSGAGYQGGLGVMRTAVFQPTAANGLLTYASNGSSQVHAGGDSGSTCFTAGGLVTSVMSRCSGSGQDISCNGQVTNNEWNSISSCVGTAPSAYRDWAMPIVQADVEISYVFRPAVAGNFYGEVRAPNSTPAGFYADSSTLIENYAVRSGWYEITILEEPPRTQCKRIRGQAPLTGNVEARGACLGDGVVSAILG